MARKEPTEQQRLHEAQVRSALMARINEALDDAKSNLGTAVAERSKKQQQYIQLREKLLPLLPEPPTEPSDDGRLMPQVRPHS